MENKIKRNYDLVMQEQMKTVEKGTPLLLHSCCAPCSSTCLERLKDKFKITILYYNPNIDEEEEYEKRKAEQIRFLKETGWAEFLDCDHDALAFAEIAKGLENEPERGSRCLKCFKLRLLESAKYAHERGISVITTTLASSRWKSLQQIEEAGLYAQMHYPDVTYWAQNWRKGGLSERRIQIIKEYNFYNQRYCGCEFSQKIAELQRHKDAK